MAFPKPTPRPVAASIGEIHLDVADIRVPDPNDARSTILARKYFAYIERLDTKGVTVDVVSFDVEPHLTAQQITGLSNLIGVIRTRAIAELL